MDDIGYSGPLYNNKTHAIKVRTGDDILNAAKDAVCGELMVAKGGQFPGLYIATKTSGDDVELCRISEITPENKLPIDNNYSLSFDGVDDQLDFNSTLVAQGEFTFSLWFKPKNQLQGMIWWGAGMYLNHYGPSYGNKLILNLGGQIESPTDSVMQGKWNHVFITRGSDNIVKLILNGGSPINPPNVETNYLSISNLCGGINSDTFFNGHIDEFAYWDSDQSENFSAIYNNSGIPTDLISYSPVGWWRMGDNDGGTGTTITDQGSGGNNATLVNGPTFSTDVPPLINTYSVSFDGTNAYMDTGSTFQSTVRGGFSVSFWMKFSSIGSDVYSPFGSWDDDADQQAFYISNPAGGENMTYRLEVGGSKITLMALPTGGWTTDWNHIAVTCEQSGGSVVAKIYIDGVYKATESMTATLSSFVNTRSIYVGARNRTDGRNAYFPGLIDEVAIFGSALSDGSVSTGQTAGGDIATLYNSGVPADISSFSPVAWWRMGDNDGGTGTTITDQGSGGNDGTLVNGPTFSTDVLPFNTYSVQFDGTNDYVDCGTVSALNNAANFSLTMWVNFQTFVENSYGYNILFGAGTGATNRFILNAIRNSSTLADTFEVYFCDPGVASIVNTSAGLTTNTWYHMAVYKSGADMSFYINNTLMGSRSNAPSTGSGANFAIGRGLYSGTYSANILADEVAVWDSDQSSNKDSIYNNGVPNDISSLNPTHWWRMGDDDGGTGTTITDQGSGGNNGTLTNGPTFSTTVPS